MAQEYSAVDHLTRLKEGILLVKLYTRNQAIEAMRERGYETSAQNLEKEQHFKHLAITNAFEMKYNFTPKVYFFYSDHSKKVMYRDFEGILMGYDLQTLHNVNIKDTAFYVAEFGYTEEKDIAALVVRDNNLDFLEAPFPYFVRTFEGWLFLERSYPKVVELWNEKLFNKYHQFFPSVEKE